MICAKKGVLYFWRDLSFLLCDDCLLAKSSFFFIPAPDNGHLILIVLGPFKKEQGGLDDMDIAQFISFIENSIRNARRRSIKKKEASNDQSK